ncbi:hypothetical protein [Cellulophaga baltica]|uniref:hypothetical protein n=1 Tax=Cellulophaga baltica TaxID=76594 RepID=UPI00130DF79C|nr:hypothetical protein [Cellulophaga baltica]
MSTQEINDIDGGGFMDFIEGVGYAVGYAAGVAVGTVLVAAHITVDRLIEH